ncbi:MAG: ribonuclease R [Rhodospirillales bacterium]|nr:ribonuclease R [Rhodospirillales bacterium]
MAPLRPDNEGVPSRDELLDFISDNPGRVGKRDIARAFGISGSHQRAELNRLLRDLKHEGQIGRNAGRKLNLVGDLPSELIVKIVAIDDDGIAIAEPLLWHGDGPPPKIPLKPLTGRKPHPAPGLSQCAMVQLRHLANGGYEGRVRRLIAPDAQQVVGVFKRTPTGDRIQPTDRRQSHDYRAELPTGLKVEDGDLVLAEPMSTQRFGPVPARVVRRLGTWADADAVCMIAITTHGIPVHMPEEALAEAERAEPVTEPGKRKDLRDVPLVTIDGVDARDHDDAVFAEPTTEHEAAWHAIVAVADVAHYVRPGSELDRAAYRRGNSVYFPDRVVPMLPERLSNDLCSLRPNEDRACLAAHLWIDNHGTLRRWRFVRGLMRSAARLTYDEVEAHRGGQPSETTSALPDGLIDNLYGVYAALRGDRVQRGALDIDRPERQVEIGEDGRIKAITQRIRHDSHKLIEELMIAANIAAALQFKNRRMPVMYRIHDQPSPEKIEGLREFLQSLGLSLRKSAQLRPADFASILGKVSDTEHKDAVNEAVLRSQSQAEYAPENIGHFGLGLEAYCHFTSPIRRYADLLVHRALIRGLKLGSGGLPENGDTAFDKTGVHLTATERRAMKAERDAMDRYLADYMADRVGAVMPGRIVGVGRFGVFVRLDEIGADGLLPARRLPGGPFRVLDGRQELEGDGIVFRLGDSVTVELVEADPVAATIGFDLVEGGIERKTRRPGTSSPRGRKHRSGPRRRKR